MAKEPTKINIEKEIVTNRVEGTVLGQRVSAPTSYTPEILVKVPREENRRDYDITNDIITGYDDWYAYECSTVTDSGIPVYFGLNIRYPSNSKYIVESKSLKLYFNSFNMEKLGKTRTEAIQEYLRRAKKDLEALLETEVQFGIFDSNEYFTSLEGQFEDLTNIVKVDNISVTEFKEAPEVLKYYDTQTDIAWKFSGLRSNCKITNQPDFATVYIKMQGSRAPVPESLIQYLASFRNESHFHEECCEMIYKRLLDLCNPNLLWVRCNYTRRGGLDISPTRYTPNFTDTTPPSRTVYQ